MRHRAVDVTPGRVIGRRVVVRHRLHGDRHSATDILGMLESWENDVLRVRTADGTVHDVAEADLIAVKAVPARPVTLREIRDLEAAAAWGWRATEIDQLGGWLLRAARGFTRRANSCLPLDDPGLPVHEALDRIEVWYRERGLTPSFQVPGPLGRSVRPLLDSRGWSQSETVDVLTASTDDVRIGTRTDLPSVRIDDQPDDAWLETYHYHGAELPAHAIDVLINADTTGFASVDQDGQRVAIARGVITAAPSGTHWLGISAVEVTPPARRQGLGSHVVAALAGWAHDLGTKHAYLQVVADNDAAQAAYRKLGFGDHHGYHYRTAP